MYWTYFNSQYPFIFSMPNNSGHLVIAHPTNVSSRFISSSFLSLAISREKFFVAKQARATILVDIHTHHFGADLFHLLNQRLPGITMADLAAYLTVVQEGKGMAQLMNPRGRQPRVRTL
jgi:hypothetical protein